MSISPKAVGSPLPDRLTGTLASAKLLQVTEQDVFLQKIFDWSLELPDWQRGLMRMQARHIQVRKLHKVRWSPELAREIDAAVKELSAGAHQGPLGQQGAPLPLAKLEALLDKYEAIAERAKPGQERDAGEERSVTQIGAA